MRLDGIQQSIELIHTIEDKLNAEYDNNFLNQKMKDPRSRAQQSESHTGTIKRDNQFYQNVDGIQAEYATTHGTRDQAWLGVKS